LVILSKLAGATLLAGPAIAASIVRLFHHTLPAALMESTIPAGLIWIALWFAAIDVERFGIQSCGVWNGT